MTSSPRKECNQLIGMRGEGGTKSFTETVEASQLGSHGSMVPNTAIVQCEVYSQTLAEVLNSRNQIGTTKHYICVN